MDNEKSPLEVIIGKSISEIAKDFEKYLNLFAEEEKKEFKDSGEEEIEEGIKDLVYALNNHGLKTFASCEGHKDGPYKYVAFRIPDGVSITVEKDAISIHWLEKSYGS